MGEVREPAGAARVTADGSTAPHPLDDKVVLLTGRAGSSARGYCDDGKPLDDGWELASDTNGLFLRVDEMRAMLP